MDRARRLTQDHLETLCDGLVTAFAQELEKADAVWDGRVRELRAENERLSAELRAYALEREVDGVVPQNPVRTLSPASPTPSIRTLRAPSSRKPVDEHSENQSGIGSRKMSFPIFSSMSLKQGVFRVGQKLRELDVAGTGVVKIDELLEKLRPMVEQDDVQCIEQISSLMQAFREARPSLFEGLAEDEVSYEVLKQLVAGKDLPCFKHHHIKILNALRSTCARDAALMRVGYRSLYRDEFDRVADLVMSDRFWWLEPTIFCVIICDALITGLSLDIASESSAWRLGEIVCTLFFVFEMVVKLIMSGPWIHFCGENWRWNLFDLSLILVDATHVVLSAYVTITDQKTDGMTALRDLSVVRVIRLLRVARLARIFRLQFMRDLTLMATGIFGGFRTLLWAVVVLFIFVYVMGIMTHQVMTDWKQHTPCNDDILTCDPHERVLLENFSPMFDDLFRTCFTIFRCVTSDCNLPVGRPLATTLLETQGKAVVIGYACGILFVMVCVFNLIMAVFVENTLSYAKQDQQKIEYLHHKEQQKLARKLQRLVDKIVAQARKPTSRQVVSMKYLPNKGFVGSSDSIHSGHEVELPAPFTVTREIFNAAMMDEEAADILQRMDICVSTPSKLFDILDSNGDNELDIHEVVDGIMRLRGPADKSEIVSNGLMLRCLQKNMREVLGGLEQLKHVGDRISALEEEDRCKRNGFKHEAHRL